MMAGEECILTGGRGSLGVDGPFGEEKKKKRERRKE